MQGNYWKEVQELNQRPLNQLAKQALRSVKESPDPRGLYLLQLVEWALDKGRVSLDGPLTQRETLRGFWKRSPGGSRR